MFEFLVGMLLGVWAGQALPLPSVGDYVKSYWLKNSPTVTIEEGNEEEVSPLFTGEIPISVPPPSV